MSSRVRSAAEQSTSSGAMASFAKCSAIRAEALRPRGASGRSWSARSGSSQLDFAWRRTYRCLMRTNSPSNRAPAEKETDPVSPNTRSVPELAGFKRAAVRPTTRVRRAFAISLGVILEGLVTLLGDWHDRYPGVAVAAGLLIAALAGAVGGVWSGLAVAGAGWTLNFFFVADQSLRALIALPAWLAVGALAGWLATTRRRTALRAQPGLGRARSRARLRLRGDRRHRPQRHDRQLERRRRGDLRLRAGGGRRRADLAARARGR